MARLSGIPIMSMWVIPQLLPNLTDWTSYTLGNANPTSKVSLHGYKLITLSTLFNQFDHFVWNIFARITTTNSTISRFQVDKLPDFSVESHPWKNSPVKFSGSIVRGFRTKTYISPESALKAKSIHHFSAWRVYVMGALNHLTCTTDSGRPWIMIIRQLIGGCWCLNLQAYPKPTHSMYGIFTYICHKINQIHKYHALSVWERNIIFTNMVTSPVEYHIYV